MLCSESAKKRFVFKSWATKKALVLAGADLVHRCYVFIMYNYFCTTAHHHGVVSAERGAIGDAWNLVVNDLAAAFPEMGVAPCIESCKDNLAKMMNLYRESKLAGCAVYVTGAGGTETVDEELNSVLAELCDSEEHFEKQKQMYMVAGGLPWK